jgi:hypothetical protein
MLLREMMEKQERLKEELERLRKNRSYLHRTLKNWEQMILENNMEL